MSKAIITEQHLHDIADAIIAKGGATGPMPPAQMPAAIQSIPDGVTYPVTWKNDGKTHLWLNVINDNSRLILRNYEFTNNVGEDVVVDWGDGSSTRFPVSSTTKKFKIDTEHTYSASGDYEIVISNYDSMVYVGDSFRKTDVGSYTYITPDYADSLNSVIQMEFAKVTSSRDSSNDLRLLRLVAVKFDDDCTFDTASQRFIASCQSLRTVILPESVKTIGQYAFYGCFSLESISPNKFEFLGNNCFTNCMLLADLDTSETSSFEISALDTMGIEHAVFNAERLPTGICRQCYNVRTIEIGDMCTSISGYTCTVVPRLETLVSRAAVPPIVSQSGFLQSFPTTAKIYVPYSSDHSILTAYQSATGWTLRSSQMYELNPDGTIPTGV